MTLFGRCCFLKVTSGVKYISCLLLRLSDKGAELELIQLLLTPNLNPNLHCTELRKALLSSTHVGGAGPGLTPPQTSRELFIINIVNDLLSSGEGGNPVGSEGR